MTIDDILKFLEQILALVNAFLCEFKRLHIWLVRFRILPVCVVIFSCWLVFDIWSFSKLHYELLNGAKSDSGIGFFLFTAVGLIQFSFMNIAKRHEDFVEK